MTYIFSRLTLSQNRVRRHTLPTPLSSCRRVTFSSRRCTSPFHLSIHRRSSSLTLSLSTAFLLATSPGAMGSPGTHSGGSTALCTSASGDGRLSSCRLSRIDTSDRASRRETTDVGVRKMCRVMRSASGGRAYSNGGRTWRVRRMRRRCRSGATQSRRSAWLAYKVQQCQRET